jgi:ribosome maturation factor RimP
MDQNKVFKLIQEAIDVNKELFLIQQHISPNGDIEVIVDGDNGVALEECIRISRHIEHNLDRESDDFSLIVTTPDITKPISHSRQYYKNMGRTLQLQLETGKLEGTLIEVLPEAIKIEYQTKEPKTIGKGKQTVIKQDIISFDKITKAKVKIVFN